MSKYSQIIELLLSNFNWYPGEVSVGSQLGQCGADGVTGVWHSSISAGRVWQGVRQRGPLLRQTGLKFPRPLLENLQRGADTLKGFLGLPHGCRTDEEEDETELKVLIIHICMLVCVVKSGESLFSFYKSHNNNEPVSFNNNTTDWTDNR